MIQKYVIKIESKELKEDTDISKDIHQELKDINKDLKARCTIYKLCNVTQE